MRDKQATRSNVILELIQSERDYVKHLHDVVEGYLLPARRHPEIFTGERINTIFSNLEQVYDFQKTFLESLEQCINWQQLSDSQVGDCFLKHEKGFNVYHYYCNNHPNAISELQDLYTKPRFVKFFEACRLLQNMIDLSLDGFLLTPIQRICKYPLQLNELLKNTDEDHPDFEPVRNALETMRNCANLANERKRRIEALADIMSFQEKVENWTGPKLNETSSILIHCGEVSKMNSHTWSQGVQLYLFDHLLLMAKKDLLKRNNLILKGRIGMDMVTEISDADEYKPKRSFKLYCSEQQKWFIFTTRSEKEKDEWMNAFERERSLVEADENEGFHITEREIGVARRALQNRKHSRSARYRHKRPDTAIVDQLDLNDANLIMNRTLSLPSCIHPSHVMNFVEDSRVVSPSTSASSSSARKKSSSPLNSTRSKSPPSSSGAGAASSNASASCANYLDDDSFTDANSSTGGWFRKMGSKKLTRSQIYNVNGAVASQLNNNKSPNDGASPTGLVTLIDNQAAAQRYDKLEKRHRDHMVSEEQMRLYRLNNDLSTTDIPFAPVSPRSDLQRRRQSNPTSPQANDNLDNSSTATPTTMKIKSPSHYDRSIAPAEINLHKLRLDSESEYNHMLSEAKDGLHICTDVAGESYETTVVLSTGKVVRVREDAV